MFRCFRLAGVLFGTVSLLTACNSEPPETTTSKPAKTTKANAETPAATEAAPLHVSIFLEYSGGMKGFVPRGGADKPATEFQQRIGALITETQVNGVVAERKYYLCENAAPRPVKFEQLRDVVQGEVSQAALGTELPQMLEGILNRPNAGRR